MGIEETSGKKEIIPKELERQALKEMRESEKPLPFEATPEKNLSAAIQGARRALNEPIDHGHLSLSIQEQLRLQRETLLAFFTAMGIVEETANHIIQVIEQNPGESSIH